MDDSISLPPPTTLILQASNTTDTDVLEDQFKTFYAENEKLIEKSTKTDVRLLALSEKVSDIELQIDAFSETTKVVLDGLAGLGKIHPIIGPAVMAFHAIISMELSRRQNDRKVITIMLEMQNMMCAMFQLRHVKHTHIQESTRGTEKLRLHQLIESITADILQCGSDLNYYISQKAIVKLIKAKQWEQRFKTHVETFGTRRSELQYTIAAYIIGKVTTVSTMPAPDDLFEELLRRLDTPQEKQMSQISKEFKQNNSMENLVSKDQLLDRPVTMTGDVLADSEKKARLKLEERTNKSRKVLTDEEHLDFEEALKQKTLRFERLLEIQKDNYERVIARLEQQEGYQKVAMSKLEELHNNFHHSAQATQRPPPNAWTQAENGQWVSTAPNEEFNRQQDGALTPETHRMAFAASMEPAVGPGREGPSSASMFANAHVGMIYGGTFINVVHIYQSDSPPAQDDASALGGAAQ